MHGVDGRVRLGNALPTKAGAARPTGLLADLRAHPRVRTKGAQAASMLASACSWAFRGIDCG